MTKKLTTSQLILTILIAVFAVLKTVLIAVMPDATLVPTIVKVAAAIVLVLFALTGKPLKKGYFHRLIFISLLLFLIADVAIKLRASIGVLLFGLGHILLVIAFFKKKKPGRTSVLIWVAASVVVGFCMFFSCMESSLQDTLVVRV